MSPSHGPAHSGTPPHGAGPAEKTRDCSGDGSRVGGRVARGRGGRPRATRVLPRSTRARHDALRDPHTPRCGCTPCALPRRCTPRGAPRRTGAAPVAAGTRPWTPHPARPAPPCAPRRARERRGVLERTARSRRPTDIPARAPVDARAVLGRPRLAPPAGEAGRAPRDASASPAGGERRPSEPRGSGLPSPRFAWQCRHGTWSDSWVDPGPGRPSGPVRRLRCGAGGRRAAARGGIRWRGCGRW